MWTFLGIMSFFLVFIIGLVFIILGSINPKWALMKTRGPVFSVYGPILAIGFIGPIVLVFYAMISPLETSTTEEHIPNTENESILEDLPFDEEEDSFSTEEEFFDDDVASRTNPAYPGETIVFEFPHHTNGHVTVETTLLDTIRGEEAWEIIENANQFNDPPASGNEYLIAYFHILISQLEQEPFHLATYSFDLVSEGGTVYPEDVYVAGLDDPISTDLYEGAEREGQVVFEVEKDDNPYIVFMRDYMGVWFQPNESFEPSDAEEEHNIL